MIDLQDNIIRVATSLFMRQGYTATSTRQIAKILNVTQPAIYHHFSNKETIYTAVLTRISEEIGQKLNHILQQNQPPYATLLAMAYALKDDHPMNLSLLMHDIQTVLSPSAKHAVFSLWHTHYLSPFVSFFVSIQSQMLPELKPKAVSHHFLRTLSAYLSEDDGDQRESNIQLETMVTIFLRGISMHPR